MSCDKRALASADIPLDSLELALSDIPELVSCDILKFALSDILSLGSCSELGSLRIRRNWDGSGRGTPKRLAELQTLLCKRELVLNMLLAGRPLADRLWKCVLSGSWKKDFFLLFYFTNLLWDVNLTDC